MTIQNIVIGAEVMTERISIKNAINFFTLADMMAKVDVSELGIMKLERTHVLNFAIDEYTTLHFGEEKAYQGVFRSLVKEVELEIAPETPFLTIQNPGLIDKFLVLRDKINTLDGVEASIMDKHLKCEISNLEVGYIEHICETVIKELTAG